MYGMRYKIEPHSFACVYVVVPAPFVEKTVLSLVSDLGTFVKSQLIVLAGVYFWSLSSSVCISILTPVPACFDYCSFVVKFGIRK